MHSDLILKSTLVLLGHGTELNAGSAIPVNQHADELRRRNIFSAVLPAFWKQSPQIKEVLAEISTPFAFIVPFFISEGYFSAQVIPAELGFDYPSKLICSWQGCTFIYCHPVGLHSSMTKVILSRATAIVQQFPFPRIPQSKDITLFIAGHGTGRHSASRKSVDDQVKIIRGMNIYADVHAIFMEDSPRIEDCYKLAATKNLVVVPLFMSNGLHVVEDIPVLLGEPAEYVRKRLKENQPTWRNPSEIRDKLVWYSSAVGTEPLMADVILEQVREAAKLHLANS